MLVVGGESKEWSRRVKFWEVWLPQASRTAKQLVRLSTLDVGVGDSGFEAFNSWFSIFKRRIMHIYFPTETIEWCSSDGR